MKSFIAIFTFCCFAFSASAQSADTSALAQAAREGNFILHGMVKDGDTIPVKQLPILMVVEDRQFRSPAEAKRYGKLKRNVVKVYPYAKLAGDLLNQYSDTVSNMETDRQRRKFLKKVEKELLATYGDEMKGLTMSQGRVLIKLIDRETGDSSYDLVKDFRGGLSAFFWQGLAKMFGQDLKSEYDPNGADKPIEDIVVLIEGGYL